MRDLKTRKNNLTKLFLLYFVREQTFGHELTRSMRAYGYLAIGHALHQTNIIKR